MSPPSRPKPVFRGVPSSPGYAVSDRGRVFSCLRGTWKLLKPGLGWLGGRKKRLLVTTFRDGKKTPMRVDRLVAEAFHGPCPPGLCVIHRDGNHKNCAAANLYYGTHAEANKAAGKRRRGSNHHLVKLTAAIVVQIRQTVHSFVEAGEPIQWKAIAEASGTSYQNAQAIAKGRSWPDVDAGVPLWKGPGVRPVFAVGDGRKRAAKLTLAECKQIQERAAAFEPLRLIHASFPQVCYETVYAIATGRHKREGL